MFKKLGRMLKKGAMSVEYIVIGVCVIGMAVLATAFVSNKMDVAMGQENNSTGDTNTGNGDNQGSGSNDNIEVDPKTTLEYYGICPGYYSRTKMEVTEETMIMYNPFDSSVKTSEYNFKTQMARKFSYSIGSTNYYGDGVWYPVSSVTTNDLDSNSIGVTVKWDFQNSPSSQTFAFQFYLSDVSQTCK